MNVIRKICVVTGTRAEYGILSRLMLELQKRDDVRLQIIATNMHLSPEFGLTYREIEADGFVIDKKIEMLLSSDSPVGTVKSMGLASIGFADAYSELQPDIIVILGDRYEMLAAASAALIMGIPVAHLHGGEITEGAYDDAIRHAITKMSYFHFTSTEEYRKRVIQLGEDPQRVFRTGAPAVENISNEQLLSLGELEKSIEFKLGDKFLLVTFHPVTTEPGAAAGQTRNVLSALESFFDKGTVLITLPNSDSDSRLIASMIKEWASRYPDKVKVVVSLGRKRYYSALALCTGVMGNSSSGLIEAPSFRKPTLNIGDRQKGRTQGNTVINCGTDEAAIIAGMKEAFSGAMVERIAREGTNPYEKKGTLKEIIDVLTTAELPLNLSKHFYDVDFE